MTDKQIHTGVLVSLLVWVGPGVIFMVLLNKEMVDQGTFFLLLYPVIGISLVGLISFIFFALKSTSKKEQTEVASLVVSKVATVSRVFTRVLVILWALITLALFVIA